MKFERGEGTVIKHLSVSNKFTFPGTNYIPQLFAGNLRSMIGKFRETVKNERKTTDHLCSKTGLEVDTKSFKTEK